MNLQGRLIGNYVLDSKLGEGGMGEVWIGRHPHIGKRVAIKVLRPDLASSEEIVTRFFNEAKAVNEIRHPNIVDIIDFGQEGGIVYFMMEMLQGEPLQKRLESTGVTYDEATYIIAQCASALAASHREGIVHRDLKPDNIFLIKHSDDHNVVKLLDFGIAKLTKGAGAGKTQAGQVFGTPTFMSPEQASGATSLDARADIYSLGVVMYLMIAGRVPFVGESITGLLMAHINTPPDPPSVHNPACPPHLEAVVMRALQKDPAARFQSMDELHHALTGRKPTTGRTIMSTVTEMLAASPKGPRTGEGPAVERVKTIMGGLPRLTMQARRGGGSGGLMLVAVALLLFVGGGGAGYWFYSRPKPPPPKPVVVAAKKIEAPAEPPPKPEPALRRIQIVSTPPGAVITRVGRGRVGETPLTLMVRPDEPPFSVELTLDGYQTERHPVTPGDGNDVIVDLTALDKHHHHHSSSSTAPRKKGGDVKMTDELIVPTYMK